MDLVMSDHQKEDTEKNFGSNQEPNLDPIPKWYEGPLRIMLLLFLLLIIIAWPLSYYAGKIDPEPGKVPGRLEPSITGNLSQPINDLNLAYLLHSSASDDLKPFADKISLMSCGSGRVCYAKALFYYVRDNHAYVSDPVSKEYIEDPRQFLSVGGGDCESGALALASLMESVGIPSQLVLVPRHAIVRIYLPQAQQKYLSGGWVYLDWTCRSCGFGEISANFDMSKAKTIDI